MAVPVPTVDAAVSPVAAPIVQVRAFLHTSSKIEASTRDANLARLEMDAAGDESARTDAKRPSAHLWELQSCVTPVGSAIEIKYLFYFAKT